MRSPELEARGETFAMTTETRLFLLALAGSVAIEALKVVRAYEAGRPLPARYRRIGFWFARSEAS